MPVGLGIDIGARYLKVVALRGSARHPVLAFFRVFRVEGERIGDEESRREALREALRSALHEIGTKHQNCVVSLSPSDLIVRRLVVPFVDDAHIRQTIKFETEGHIPAAIEDVIVGYQKTGEREGHSEVCVYCMPKAAIASTLALLRECGLDPVSLSSAPLLGVDGVRFGAGLSGAFLLVDIGARETAACAVKDGRIPVMRILRTGFDSALTAVARETGLSIEEVESECVGVVDDSAGEGREEGSLPEKGGTRLVLDEQVRSVARRIGDEIARSVLTDELASDIERLVVVGGASRWNMFCEVLRERTGLSIDVCDLLNTIEHDLDSKQQERFRALAAPALGAAAVALGATAIGVNFRQEEFAYRRRFERVRWPLAAALFGVTLAFSMLWANAWKEAHHWNRVIRSIKHEEQGIFVTLFPDKPPPSKRKVSEAIAIQKKALLYDLDIRGTGEVPVLRSAFDILREIFALLPDSTPIAITSISVDQKGASIFALTDSYSSAEKIQLAIDSSVLFVAETRDLRMRDKMVSFKLEISYEGQGTNGNK